MFVNEGFVFGEIDAEGLVGSHITLDPLNVRSEFGKHGVRFLRCGAQFIAFGTADLGNIAFDNKASHDLSPISEIISYIFGGLLTSRGLTAVITNWRARRDADDARVHRRNSGSDC